MPAPLSSTDPPFFYSSTGQRKNGTHHGNALRCWICSSLAFLVLAPVISIMLGLHLHARDFRYVPDGDIVPFNDRTLRIEAVLIGADPFAGLMTMDWTIAGEEKSLCSELNLGACTDVNIFFDKYARLPFSSLCVH